MKQKLLNFLISLTVLSTSFLNIHNPPIAHAASCTITSITDVDKSNDVNPVEPSDTTKKISLKLNVSPVAAFGDKVSIYMKYENNNINPIEGSSIEKYDVLADGTINIPKINFASKNNQTTQNSDNDWEPGDYKIVVVVGGQQNASNPLCETGFSVSGFGYCAITLKSDNNYTISDSGTTTVGIVVQFDAGDNPNDDNSHKHRIEISKIGAAGIANYEATTNQLKTGWTIPHSWALGRYNVRVTEQLPDILNLTGDTCDLNEPFRIETAENGGGGVGCENSDECSDGKICLEPNEEGVKKCGEKTPYNWGQTKLACEPDENNNYKCHTAIGDISTTPEDFLQNVLKLVLGLAGGILLILIIINGYKLMTSQGDPEKIKEAREGIISAIAGILMIIFSLSLLTLLTKDVLGIPGFK